MLVPGDAPILPFAAQSLQQALPAQPGQAQQQDQQVAGHQGDQQKKGITLAEIQKIQSAPGSMTADTPRPVRGSDTARR